MRPRLAQLHQSGATDGQVPIWDDTAGMWVPGTGSAGGAGTLGTLGFAQVTASQTGIGTTITDLTGLAVTVTVGSGRRIRISWMTFLTASISGDTADIWAREGSTSLGVSQTITATANGVTNTGSVILTPSAGSHTYKLSAQAGTPNINLVAASTIPAYILVEDIGT